MFCDIVTPDREPYEGDPRHVLRRALAARRVDGLRRVQRRPRARVLLLPLGQAADRQAAEVLDEGGYFDLTTLDAGSDVRRETVLALEQLGIHVEYTHHEVGPSQHEIDMRYAPALKMADDCMTYRITVKEYAMKYGWHATFMPKPLFGENGSGMHTHQSLFKDGRNAFYDADDQYFLSPVGKAFIAGQLKHAREVSSIFAQWVNSYKRLVPGYEAPVYVAWSRRNRSALVRVPLYHPGKEQATRMELRCPDPACNPYLTFAALLQAGLEGIEKGYELPEPMEKNLYHLSPDERKRLGHRAAAGDARRGDRADRRVRARAAHARRAHVQPLHRDQAAGVGGLPRAGLPAGSSTATCRSCSSASGPCAKYDSPARTATVRSRPKSVHVDDAAVHGGQRARRSESSTCQTVPRTVAEPQRPRVRKLPWPVPQRPRRARLPRAAMKPLRICARGAAVVEPRAALEVAAAQDELGDGARPACALASGGPRTSRR